MGKAMSRYFDGIAVDRILTAEISGIAPALMTAIELNVPVFMHVRSNRLPCVARFTWKPHRRTPKAAWSELLVSGEFLRSGENILIIDDFLASGETLKALGRMVQAADATLVGVGVVVEKSFENGRNAMIEAGFDVPIHALATITSMDGDNISLA